MRRWVQHRNVTQFEKRDNEMRLGLLIGPNIAKNQYKLPKPREARANALGLGLIIDISSTLSHSQLLNDAWCAVLNWLFLRFAKSVGI